MKKIVKVTLLIIALVFTSIVVFYGYQDIPVEKLKEKYANKASSFVAINGMDVHYRDEGVKLDSIPIVLIHGTGASLHTFDAWTDELKKTKRVIRMDLPAYGLTGPFPDRNYSMDNYVKFIHDFLSSLKIKECILGGNSLGGQIAWNFTVNEPKMVEKLILIDAAGYPMKSKSVPMAFKVAQTPLLNKLLLYVTPRFMVRASVENVYHDKSKVTDLMVERYFELTLREGNRQAFVDRFSMKSPANSSAKIKTIKQPTLILWGAEDFLIPLKNAYQFQKDLPNNSLVILKEVGHTPMEESPTESLKSVLKFIKNE
ncbi:alpha/beta fold hydrolase [Tenacibaculum retecalamus]|uniref:alpha/beta fold hydrolase n=1 Tax=Tenacibaculum retecalamus TaxID=3018315 RepID=UPI0023D936B3|nr:alpha/beta hydrolase [Tenacibaculum retecalamus]WBX72441.1 alpha/beta hydrolase [Tenacibaculum retecalamus]